MLGPVAAQLLQTAGTRRKWLFKGDLGTGKTTLIQALCRQLGVEQPVTSPTFALVNEYTYRDAESGADMLIHHLDLYRLKNLEEAIDIGIEDYLYDPYYCFVEWPELIESILPPDTFEISLSIIEHSCRKILYL